MKYPSTLREKLSYAKLYTLWELMSIANFGMQNGELGMEHGLKPNNIQLYLGQSVLPGPNIQSGRSNLIDQRYRETQSGHIDRFNIMLTGVAGIDPDMIILRSVEVPQASRLFLAAVCADQSPEIPWREAVRAEQVPGAAFGFVGQQEAQLGFACA
jgi:hypothetical protein